MHSKGQNSFYTMHDTWFGQPKLDFQRGVQPSNI